jgi:uncharacterized repeat protein (TIGR01451 family)
MSGWDGSDVAVTGRCIGNNEVRFTLKNIGSSAMTAAQSYLIIEDNIMVRSGTFQLIANGSDSVTITADPNRIYRIIANETTGNPANNTQESFMVWGCNGTNNVIHWGFVNQFGLNFGDYSKHNLCTAVRTSFDPNDISAVPTGTQAEHFIPKDTEIAYMIRFQNTGNDTAFVVRITNPLPAELDKTTLNIGASSHPMTYSLKGNGVLEFLFTNILLPDSTTNEPLSHGFVRYTIRTKPNLATGQTINNYANIYFDVNAPVITNTYTHTIADDIASVFLSVTTTYTKPNIALSIIPNPMHDAAVFEITNKSLSANKNTILTVYNTLGQVVKTQYFENNRLLLERENLPQGIYFYTVLIENELVSKGKVMVK